MAELKTLKKDALVALAAEHKLDESGTKDELVARLAQAGVEAPEVEDVEVDPNGYTTVVAPTGAKTVVPNSILGKLIDSGYKVAK